MPKITEKDNDSWLLNLTIRNGKNGRMSSCSVRDLSENPRRLCALVRRCARAIHRASAPPHSDRDDRVDGSSDHTVPHKGARTTSHRATQTIAPDRWKSTRATCNWQGATWSSLIATFNWPTARNQNGGWCSCQQLSENQEKLFPSG